MISGIKFDGQGKLKYEFFNFIFQIVRQILGEKWNLFFRLHPEWSSSGDVEILQMCQVVQSQIWGRCEPFLFIFRMGHSNNSDIFWVLFWPSPPLPPPPCESFLFLIADFLA